MIDHSLTLSKSLTTGRVQGTKEVLYKAAMEMVNPDCHGETGDTWGSQLEAQESVL